MSTWASKRKTLYATAFIAAIVFLIALPLFLIFYEKPTCFDGKMNGRETGVDCGGKCAKVCSADFLSPVITWARSHKIAEGVYNLGAYIENPNPDGGAVNVPYTFTLYDSAGLPIAERRGTTYIPPYRNIVVFENAVLTNERVPARITFEFDSRIPWEKSIQNAEYLVASNGRLTEDGRPRLEAEVHNRNVEAYQNIDVFAILYDINGNVVAFSKTKIDSLAPNQKERAVFTWPLPLTAPVARTEVIPTVKP